MKRDISLLLLLVMLISSSMMGQYVVEYPYFLSSYIYNLPLIGSSYFPLPRPGTSYESMRLRSLGSGFEGLIADSYTDHFRNPGVRIEDHTQVFGDVGSVNDFGKFMLGSFAEPGHGTIGGALIFDRLQNTESTTEYSNTPPSPSSSSTTKGTVTTTNENTGGRLSYTMWNSSTATIGGAYEYMHRNDRTENVSAYMSFSPSYTSTRKLIYETSTGGDIHVITVGATVALEDAQLHLRGRGVFSSYEITQRYENRERSGSFVNSSISNSPTDIKTKSGLASLTYIVSPNEGSAVRILLEVAVTSYDAPGSSLFQYESGDTLTTTYSSTTKGKRNTEGSVVDIKVGAGFQRAFVDNVVGYAGFSANYVYNSADGDLHSESTQSSPPGTTSTSDVLMHATRDGVDVRMPIGMEYFVGEHVVVRGGVEPRYRTGESFDESTTIYSGPSTSLAKSKVDRRSLQLATSLGASIYHHEFGEISVMFGRNFADTYLWSFFLRYFI